jgi:4,5-DOPA dioxygenase extradiol
MSTPSSLRRPAVPAGAYDEHLARTLPIARDRRTWSDSDGSMPSLFVSHGAPFTLDDPEWLGALFAWSDAMPRPRAILVVSAHWEEASATISETAAGTPLLYDFSGFHPRYKTLPYATPDAGALGARVRALLSGTPVHERVGRGLDHGAFIPLMAMYPAAEVPVVQLSMPGTDAAALLDLGAKLRPLRDEGVLVIGSGFMTHSFAVLTRPELAAHTEAFDTWATDALSRQDVDALLDYRVKAPGSSVAHPTAEHFVPLLLAAGAADHPESATTTIDRFVLGNSTRSLQFA